MDSFRAFEDGGGSVSIAPLSSDNDHLLLSATTVKTYTIPADTKTIQVTSDLDLWCKKNADSAIPAGDVVDGTGSFMIPLRVPTLLYVEGLVSLRFICAGAAKVSISRWS